MIKKYLATAAAAVLAFSMSGAPSGAAPLNPEDYGFIVPGTPLIENASGSATYFGPGSFLDAFFGTELLFDVFTDDLTTAVLNYSPLPILDASNSLISGSIMPDRAEFFFDPNIGNKGYLFTIDATGQRVSFEDPFQEFDTDVQLSIEEFAAVPLPASFLLIISGIGGLILVGRRKRV